MKNQKRFTMLMVLLSALAVILTALPNGFMMRFYAGENGWFIKYVSGFDFILAGYGNFGPLICGILCIVMMVQGIFASWKKKIPDVRIQAMIACLGSLSNNILSDATIISWLITGLTAVLAVLSIYAKWKEK